MKPIIHLKDGLLSNIASIAFLLALAVFGVWLYRRSHSEVSTNAWVFAALFVLGCYFPLANIRAPKSCTLIIEGDELVWRIRGKAGEGVREERLPLRQIRALQFVIPREVTARRSQLLSCAELYFVTPHGRRELPLEFFPGIYRERIVAAVREHVPDVLIEDVAHAA